MIVVTGATGNVGRTLVAKAVAGGFEIRAVTRRPESAHFPDGVDVVRADLGEPSSLPPVLEGVDQVFLMAPTPCLARYAVNLCCHARSAGVRRIVMLSSSIVELGRADELSVAHRAAEQTVVCTGLPCTFLRPGAFMSNALAWADAIRNTGHVSGLAGNFPAAPIDPDDIAAVALHVLRSDVESDGVGSAHSLTGPKRLTPREQVAILGGLLKSDLVFDELSEQDALSVLLQTHDRSAALSIMASLRRPDVPWAEPLPTVERLTGQRPATFESWASRHLNAFRLS
jgi:uncharacterized protein YbjT (DUF2867 family)